MGIDTPLSLRALLHLDGLLGFHLSLRGQSPTDIPLARHEGVWQGSAAMLETGTFGAIASIQTRIKHVSLDTIPSGIFEQTQSAHRKIGPMSPMRRALSQYPLLQGIRAVWFTGRGDSARVEALLQEVRNLGAMGRTGYGRVADLQIMELRDHALTGIASSAGMPVRTVAIETWDALGLGRHASAVISLQRPCPPYWIGPTIPCISPIQFDMTGTATEIRALAAVD